MQPCSLRKWRRRPAVDNSHTPAAALTTSPALIVRVSSGHALQWNQSVSVAVEKLTMSVARHPLAARLAPVRRRRLWLAWVGVNSIAQGIAAPQDATLSDHCAVGQLNPHPSSTSGPRHRPVQAEWIPALRAYFRAICSRYQTAHGGASAAELLTCRPSARPNT